MLLLTPCVLCFTVLGPNHLVRTISWLDFLELVAETKEEADTERKENFK